MELPDDVLANILCRVHPPRDLAACRRVGRGWRAVIDAHKLVLPHLLPGELRGVFINYKTTKPRDNVWSDTGFFGRTPLGNVDTRLSSTPAARCAVIDHCNGLLLCTDHDDYQTRFIYNPATRRSSAPLPPPPRAEESSWTWGIRPAAYLLFEPATSLNYEVFLLPEPHLRPWRPAPGKLPPPPPFNVGRLFADGADEWPDVETDDDGEDWIVDSESEKISRSKYYATAFREYREIKDTMKLMEWPPPVYMVQVFSSVIGRWEDRAFVREGDAAGTVADMWPHQPRPDFEWSYRPRRLYGISWQRSLYVHCHNGFVTRFTLLTGKYRVIHTPKIVCEHSFMKIPTPHLAKSESGVYYIAIDYTMNLHVWLLNDSVSHERPVWEMKHNANLGPSISKHVTLLSDIKREEIEKSWILDHEKAPTSWDKGWYYSDNDDDDEVVSVEEEPDESEVEEENEVLEEDVIENGEHEESEEEEEEEGNQNNGPDELGYQYNITEGFLDLLGLHPDQEIVFLGYKFDNCAYSYCLRTSKLEYLGDHVLTRGESSFYWPNIRESYVYTPCFLDLLSDQNDNCIDLSYWT